jgi:carbonic anhydrase/acetyltransferase-like protein (isoleucine patch superfamily)
VAAKRPRIHPSVFIAATASIVGEVRIGPDSSVWYGAVVRGDIAPITIGAATNIQDGAILHVGKRFPCVIGDRVTVGHGAIVHGATVEDDVMIAMGACVLNGAVIGSRSIVGAGAVVTEGVIVPPNSIVVGIPARVAKSIGPEQLKQVLGAARNYVRYARDQARATSRTRLPAKHSNKPISRRK